MAQNPGSYYSKEEEYEEDDLVSGPKLIYIASTDFDFYFFLAFAWWWSAKGDEFSRSQRSLQLFMQGNLGDVDFGR